MMAKFLSFKTYSSETLKLRIIDVIFIYVQHMLMKFHIEIVTKFSNPQYVIL